MPTKDLILGAVFVRDGIEVAAAVVHARFGSSATIHFLLPETSEEENMTREHDLILREKMNSGPPFTTNWKRRRG